MVDKNMKVMEKNLKSEIAEIKEMVEELV